LVQEHRKKSPSPVVGREPTGKVNKNSKGKVRQKVQEAVQTTVQTPVQPAKLASKGSLVLTKKIHTEIEYIVEDEWTEPDVTENRFLLLFSNFHTVSPTLRIEKSRESNKFSSRFQQFVVFFS